jgi:hypothetical protein
MPLGESEEQGGKMGETDHARSVYDCTYNPDSIVTSDVSCYIWSLRPVSGSEAIIVKYERSSDLRNQ